MSSQGNSGRDGAPWASTPSGGVREKHNPTVREPSLAGQCESDDGPDTGPSRRDDAKAAAARAFDGAIRETGLANAAVARDLCVSAKSPRVAKLRSDDPDDLDVVPNLADLVLMREELFDAAIARLKSARKAFHGEPVAKSLEQLMLETVSLDCDTSSKLSAIVGDGVVEPTEVPIALAALDRSDHARAKLRVGLLKRGRR